MTTRGKVWQQLKRVAKQQHVPLNLIYNSSGINVIQKRITEIISQGVQKAQVKKATKQAKYVKKTNQKEKKNFAKIKNSIKDFFKNPEDKKEVVVTRETYSLLKKFGKFNNDYNLLEHNGNTTFIKKPFTNFTANDLRNDKLDYDDLDFDLINFNINDITFEWRKKDKERKNGAFFPYYNKTKLDLTKYQIYTNKHKYIDELNCLQKALLEAGLPKQTFQQLLTLFMKSKDEVNLSKNDYIPKTMIKKICDFANIKIELTILRIKDDKEEQSIERFGKIGQTYKIGLLANHYFFNEMTCFTKKDFGIKDRGNKYPTYTSFKLIRFMLENKDKYLQPITFRNNNSSYDVKKMVNYNDNEQLYAPTKDEAKLVKTKTFNPPSIFMGSDGNYLDHAFGFFDFEATTDGDKHQAYQIAYELRCGETKFFQGEFCALNFLKSIKQNTIFYAHNMKYDLQFIIKYLSNITDFIKTGSQFKCISGEFYNKDTKKYVKLCFKDSMSIISEKLSQFGKMFKLNTKKEILPYEIYTTENVKKTSIKIEEAKKFLSISDYNEFKKNISEWNLAISEDEFDHMKYSEIYCKMDVTVLHQGFDIMKQWMFDITNINIDYCISLPQIVYAFGIDSGVFEGCYELAGQSRDFIQRALVGGRTMTRDNEMHHTTEKIQDFDGVSQYPSSIYKMDGFLLGKPKVIQSNELNYDFLSKQDGYFVEVDIIDIPIKRHFPLLSRMENDESRIFSNDIRGRGIYLDKIGLEDAIKFQDIKFNIIRGYYYNESRNSKNKDFIKKLFDERLIKKNEKNPIQLCYKLLMNSFYGKTIQNPVTKNYKFIYGKEKAEKSFLFNTATMISSTKISEELFMLEEHKSINQHFNLPHVGIEILSMSKRIMNEVMCLAEDLDIEIYYQDTDSMHIVDGKFDLLSTEYEKIYNRELMGEDMGQFNCDFDYESKDRDPVAIESYFLGKKCYMDVISCMNNNVETFEYHCRMRGVPSTCIKKFQIVGKTYDNVLNIYKDLYNHETIEFELVDKRVFKYNKNFSFCKYENPFTRKINF